MQQEESSYKLCNIVEEDDSFVGVSGGKQGRGTNKAKVLVQVSITKDGKPEYAKMTVVDNIKSDTVNA